MKLLDLMAALRPWMRHETWDSLSPIDLHRFHLALHDAFTRSDGPISFYEFEHAMHCLVRELHPRLSPSFRENLINDFADRAATVGQDLGALGLAA